ncbi:hypothetical protein [Enterococcus mundtii]|uniref:Uncharacterized protein n=1 Tax=Enterococcus mundtii TaxID=53346 RepID=A0A2T5DDR8_ENTMU|nr:hypothetical protein [Enterococcus mundtii]PTO36005.1 hypothetical protein C6N14_05380 [Enterococcus mundtii]
MPGENHNERIGRFNNSVIDKQDPHGLERELRALSNQRRFHLNRGKFSAFTGAVYATSVLSMLTPVVAHGPNRLNVPKEKNNEMKRTSEQSMDYLRTSNITASHTQSNNVSPHNLTIDLKNTLNHWDVELNNLMVSNKKDINKNVHQRSRRTLNQRSQFRNLTAENAAEQIKNTLKGFVEEIQKPPTSIGAANLPLEEIQKPPTTVGAANLPLEEIQKPPTSIGPANLPLEEIQKPPTSIGAANLPLEEIQKPPTSVGAANLPLEEIQKPPTAVGQVNLPFGEAQKPQTAIGPVKKTFEEMYKPSTALERLDHPPKINEAFWDKVTKVFTDFFKQYETPTDRGGGQGAKDQSMLSYVSNLMSFALPDLQLFTINLGKANKDNISPQSFDQPTSSDHSLGQENFATQILDATKTLINVFTNHDLSKRLSKEIASYKNLRDEQNSGLTPEAKISSQSNQRQFDSQPGMSNFKNTEVILHPQATDIPVSSKKELEQEYLKRRREVIKQWDEPDRVKNQREMSADRENSHLANSVERMTTNKEVGIDPNNFDTRLEKNFNKFKEAMIGTQKNSRQNLALNNRHSNPLPNTLMNQQSTQTATGKKVSTLENSGAQYQKKQKEGSNQVRFEQVGHSTRSGAGVRNENKQSFSMLTSDARVKSQHKNISNQAKQQQRTNKKEVSLSM